MKPTVSIIVPVYNAEKFLNRCVDSILGQEYRDFELILVDDGSRDMSGSICDAYAKTDERVVVIHKENSGVSDTRNQGIERAKGTYLQFVDSDDWLTPDATKLMVRAAEEHGCDMVISDFYRVVGDMVSRKGDIESDCVIDREEFASFMMENPADYYYGVLWNKLYRRDLVNRFGIRMDAEISWCEDFMFNLEYIRYAASFQALPIPIYYYVKTKGSLANQNLTISNTVKMKLTVFEYYQRFFKTVLDEEEYEKCRLKVYRFLLDAAKDGSVVPLPLPNSRKLGEERVQASPDTLREDGPLYDAFRERKLLERYLETAALKHDLPLQDARVLLFLQSLHFQPTRRELMDLTALSRRTLSVSLQRLTARGLIRLTEQRQKKAPARLAVTFLPAAQPVLRDLDASQADCARIRLSALSAEEAAEYERLSSKVQSQIKKILE